MVSLSPRCFVGSGLIGVGEEGGISDPHGTEKIFQIRDDGSLRLSGGR